MDPTDWPLFALRIRTARLELRIPTDDDLSEMLEAVRGGIFDDAEPTPFSGPWATLPEPQRTRSALQFHWRLRAEFTPDDFDLPFLVVVDGNVAGNQSVHAHDFRLLRGVGSGSWLGRRWQGQGLGREMRAAMLEFAFSHLGATHATSAARLSNTRSIAISTGLGYRINGQTVGRFGAGEVDEQHLFRLDRADSLARDDRPEIQVTGWDLCASMFEADDAPA